MRLLLEAVAFWQTAFNPENMKYKRVALSHCEQSFDGLRANQAERPLFQPCYAIITVGFDSSLSMAKVKKRACFRLGISWLHRW